MSVSSSQEVVVHAAIPTWSFGDRMAKARTYANLTQQEIAARIGNARQSAINYERDKTQPLEAILRAWVELTRVDEHWLRTGCECRNPRTCRTVRLTVGCSAIELRGINCATAYRTTPTPVAGWGQCTSTTITRHATDRATWPVLVDGLRGFGGLPGERGPRTVP